MKKIEIEKIEIVGPYRHIQTRMVQNIYDDTTGELLGSKRWRLAAKAPDQDITDHPEKAGVGQDHKAELQKVADAVWTQKLKDEWIAKKKEDEAMEKVQE